MAKRPPGRGKRARRPLSTKEAERMAVAARLETNMGRMPTTEEIQVELARVLAERRERRNIHTRG